MVEGAVGPVSTFNQTGGAHIQARRIGSPPACSEQGSSSRRVNAKTDDIPNLNQVPRSDWLNVQDVGAHGDGFDSIECSSFKFKTDADAIKIIRQNKVTQRFAVGMLRGAGTRDDTAAIQRAMRMLTNDTAELIAGKTNQHLTLYFPPGVYAISRTLELGHNRTAHSAGGLDWVTLVGHGPSSRLLWTGPANNASMLWSNGCTRCRVEGLSFDGTNHVLRCNQAAYLCVCF